MQAHIIAVDEANAAGAYAARIRRIVATALAAGVMLLGAVTGSVWMLGRAMKDARMQQSSLEHARASILHLDEVLTMSARMAASSGESRWEERYRAHEPTLGAAIAQAKALAGPVGREAARALDVSNRTLIAIENQVFADVRAGRARDAAALLDSPAYTQGKRAYADGLAVFAETLVRDASGAEALALVFEGLALSGFLVGVAVALIGWARFRRASSVVEADYLAAVARQVAARSAVLQTQAEHLRSLARELAAVEQRERRRLSDLLHDEVQQMLAAARLQLAGYGPSPGLELLDEAIRATRTLSHELSPPLRDATTALALETLARMFRSRFALDVLVVAAVDPVVPDLIRDVIYSAVRELLFNAVKHAQAKHVQVELGVDGGDLVVVVGDDGRGFDPSSRRDGRGLAGVVERITAVGGEAHVDAAAGRGARITIRIPGVVSPS